MQSVSYDGQILIKFEIRRQKPIKHTRNQYQISRNSVQRISTCCRPRQTDMTKPKGTISKLNFKHV